MIPNPLREMNANNIFRILDSISEDAIPDDVNLLSRIAASYERKSFTQTLRKNPVLTVLIVLLALSLLTGVAYAIGRSLGYIPGIGLVEQGAPIRVLAEPVSITRDGITLTVKEAVLTSDKTIILFTLENVPWIALSHNENVGGCYDLPWVRLPNGSSLVFKDGGAQMGQSRFVYSPTPANVNNATFILPCIQETLPGLAPENWQLALRFIPAPPDMTVLPVVEIDPTATTPASSLIVTPTSNQTTNPEPNPVSITSALKIDDFYILTGAIKQPDSGGSIEFTDFHMTDSSGKEVYTETPKVPDLPNFDWGGQFKADTVSFPVILSFTGVRISPIPNSRAEFEFDAGKNPQVGQEWQINQPIQIGGRTVTLTKITLDARGGYGFDFTSDPDVTGVSLEIAGYTSNGGGGGGGTKPGEFSLSLAYSDLPKGKLRLVLSNLMVASPLQKWTLEWSPENAPAASSLYGIVLKLDKFIPLENGYYLIGHTEWTDKRVANVIPSSWLQAVDAAGREVPLQSADWQAAGITPENNQWIYKIYGKAFNGPISLRATQISVEFSDAIPLTLDLRPYNFSLTDNNLGLAYKTGIIALDVPGILANAFKATYIKEGAMRGFEIGIEADPVLRGLTFSFSSGLNTSGMRQVSSGGGSYRDEKTGLLISRISTDAVMDFPLGLVARSAQLGGVWSLSWNPPAAEAGATPFEVPQACVTLDKWKQAGAHPAAILAGLPKKVFISRGALAPDPSLFISDLDGSHEQGLVFGNGSLSPDGSKLVYNDDKNSLFILDISSGQKTALGDGFTPIWSPDGGQIAFLRQTDKGMNVFVMKTDGQDLRALTDITSNPALSGWVENGKKLLITNGLEIQTIEVASGVVKTLIKMQIDLYSSVSISPDNTWLAYVDQVTGRMSPGIYLIHSDGTEKHLLVQLDHWMVTAPLFTPDGDWLAFSAMNTDRPDVPMTPTLVNLATCEVVPLDGLNGEIQDWVK
jgi:hypothetical protein